MRRQSALASPAAVYESRFVPTLFGPWGEQLTALAGIRPGEQVLDVACGTGALTRALRRATGDPARVIGLDVSEEMLEVARGVCEGVRFVAAPAERLPFDAAAFDAVLSQFGFMFFEDKVAALQEMQRVLRPGGRLWLAVCDAVDASPCYAVLTELLHRLFGPATAEAFRAPFSLGEPDRLRAIAVDAGLHDARIIRVPARRRFPSIGALVSAERACAWTLGGSLQDDQFARLRTEAERVLAPFLDDEGELVLDLPALVLTTDRT